MTTEYYQIPSQQGLLPFDSTSPDPWLASATSALSLSDNTWSMKSKSSPSSSINPPSLFDAGDDEALAWNSINPMQNAGMMNKQVKAPKVPKQFISTTSKIDAWSVVSNDTTTNLKQHKRTPSNNSKLLTPSTVVAAAAAAVAVAVAAAPTAEDKQIEDELSNQNRYKTELCKSFNETGVCRYGAKCQFAHGKEEVRPILRHPKYKTEICKTFHTTGTCPYGIRCRFIHTKSKEETLMNVKTSSSVVELIEEEDIDDGSVVSLTPPPGIPVPKWSKSWNMMASPVMPRKSSRLTQPEPAF